MTDIFARQRLGIVKICDAYEAWFSEVRNASTRQADPSYLLESGNLIALEIRQRRAQPVVCRHGCSSPRPDVE